MELPGDRTCPRSICKGNGKVIYKLSEQFSYSPAMYESSHCYISLSVFGIIRLSNICHCSGYKTVTHHVLTLHFHKEIF